MLSIDLVLASVSMLERTDIFPDPGLHSAPEGMQLNGIF